MSDLRTDILLVERLQMLRVEGRMTIAEMAEKCGLPKSSLESYMRLEGARKPGVEALVAIASAFGVSIDWLVGLSEVRPSQDASAHDNAVACMAVVTSLLSRLEVEQAKTGAPISKDGSFAGVHKIEVATRANALVFADSRVNGDLFGGRRRDHPNGAGPFAKNGT